jgi:hypothetical protein
MMKSVIYGLHWCIQVLYDIELDIVHGIMFEGYVN